MKDILIKKWSFKSIKEKIMKFNNANDGILAESALSNNIRTYYLSMIAIPLRIIIILTFKESSGTETLRIWEQGIIASHTITLIFMIVFFIITHKLKNRKEPNTTMFVMQYIVVIVIMVVGIAIVTFDQLITTNITPFLLTCIICGVVFLIRPTISFIIYLTSYIAYYYLLGLVINNQQVLLSNRVNGITAVGLGFLLSVILWRYNYINITQKKRIEIQNEQLEQMAYYDSLTELPNRRLFDELIKKELYSIQRYGHESVVVILDIDEFKNINDTYGHLVGDNLLRQLGSIIKNKLRESDVLSRFGGDEFVILMPQTSLDGGYVFVERLRKLIMEKTFYVESYALQITCSFGVSLLNDINMEDLDKYYSIADKALYQAKQEGKNRVGVL